MLKPREKELEELVRSFVLDEIDYMTRNKLGDAEQQHNVKWARKLGIRDTLEKIDAEASLRDFLRGFFLALRDLILKYQ